MSEGNGERRDNTGGSDSSGTTPPSVASIVDSTVRVLLPQLTEKIKHQVSQAIKTALAAISTAGQTGGNVRVKGRRSGRQGWQQQNLVHVSYTDGSGGEASCSWCDILCKSQ